MTIDLDKRLLIVYRLKLFTLFFHEIQKKLAIKNDAKKIKYYQISKNYCKLLANFLAMITQFL